MRLLAAVLTEATVAINRLVDLLQAEADDRAARANRG
jgi:hypothetical protein